MNKFDSLVNFSLITLVVLALGLLTKSLGEFQVANQIAPKAIMLAQSVNIEK